MSVPAVVYGASVGFVTLLPAIETLFDLPAGETLLAAGIILAVMILPYIAAIASSSIAPVSIETRIAGLANGVPKFYVLRKVVLKQSLTGIFAGTTLGLAKALGETLAVMMLAGNAVAVQNPFWIGDNLSLPLLPRNSARQEWVRLCMRPLFPQARR